MAGRFENMVPCGGRGHPVVPRVGGDRNDLLTLQICRECLNAHARPNPLGGRVLERVMRRVTGVRGVPPLPSEKKSDGLVATELLRSNHFSRQILLGIPTRSVFRWAATYDPLRILQ